jgi:protein gp37
MSQKTKIEYADATASPWYGCSKVSPGCQNCYIESVIRKMGIKHGDARIKSKSFERECRKWNRDAVDKSCGKCACHGAVEAGCRPRIFPSLCDWLDPKAPIEWLADFLSVIQECPNLDFILLTKRPELWTERMDSVMWYDKTGEHAASWRGGNAPSNIWIGTSCENQDMSDKRIPELLNIPAKVHFLSLEPLLGLIDLRSWLHVDWVIVGGESGSKARPMEISWLESIADQCAVAGVPLFVKQDSGPRPGMQGRIPDALWARKETP